jgi:hypothetical protein
MPDFRRMAAPKLDGAGVIVTSIALSSLGLTAITYGVIEAGQNGWTGTRTLAGLAGGIVCLVGFVAWEGHRPAHHREALVDLKLFRSRSFTWGTLLATLISFALFGLLFAMPQYFEDVMGLSPLSTGVHLLPFIGGFVIGAALATALAGGNSATPSASTTPVGPNLLAALGFSVMAGGLFLGASTDVHSTTGWASLWFVISGAGLGVALPATMNAALSALSPERAGVGSGLIMASRQVGATIGVAVLGTVLSTVYRSHLDVAALPPSTASLVREGVGTGDVVATKLHSPALAQSAHVAFITSLDVMLRVCGAIAIGSTLLSILFLRVRAVASKRARTVDTSASASMLSVRVEPVRTIAPSSTASPPTRLSPARTRQDRPAAVGTGS